MLIQKLQIYQFYHVGKLISMNSSQAKKYCLLIKKKKKKKKIEQAKFTYFPLGKTSEKQTNKQKLRIKERKKMILSIFQSLLISNFF